FRPLTQTERAPLRDAPQEWIDQRFYAIVTDLVGTPTELVDPAGNLAWHHRTTLWGAFLPGPRTPAYCPLRFPGQYHDPETGLHYNYFRYYDPAGGRYTTPDPLDLAGGPNPHTYVPNPTAWLDPLGLTPCRERKPWKITPEGTEKTAKHGKFGMFYKSKSDGLWWSSDNAGHGGSAWKVFREGSKGLEWIADADEYGDFIVGKHKGATGRSIPWKELKIR
ncbi:RHS repeat-associated core domain-containing protein, partial [Streptoalloteichus tenebrarius]